MIFSMRKKILLVTVILLAAVLLSGCVGSTTWPGLSADGDTAYLANGLSVYAINLSDGEEIWHYPLQSNSKLAFNSNPVLAPNGLVIVGSSGVDHSLFAINPEKFPDGPVESVGGVQKFLCSIGLATCPEHHVEEWIFTDSEGHWVASPLVVSDKVFAPNADGNLYILDLHTGDLLKKLTLDGDSKTPNRLWSQPVSDGQHVFVTSLDLQVFGVDAETYEYWRQDLTGAIPGSGVIGSDGMLYVGSLAKQLEKFDPVTGKHEPVLDTKGWIWGTPVVNGDNLYFSDVDGNFYSYNIKSGKLNWESVKLEAGPITASPLVYADGALVVAESGNVYFVDGTGSDDVWHAAPEKGKAYTTPVSAGGYVLVSYIESDYYLIALDEDGDQKWIFPAGK